MVRPTNLEGALQARASAYAAHRKFKKLREDQGPIDLQAFAIKNHRLSVCCTQFYGLWIPSPLYTFSLRSYPQSVGKLTLLALNMAQLLPFDTLVPMHICAQGSVI